MQRKCRSCGALNKELIGMMKINKMKLYEFRRNALYVCEQAFNVALKCDYHEMDKKAKAYAVYSICTEIYDVETVIENEMDYLHYTMVYNSLRLLLDSMFIDKRQYHAEVLDVCEEPSKAWEAFYRMKYMLDNFESQLFNK